MYSKHLDGKELDEPSRIKNRIFLLVKLGELFLGYEECIVSIPSPCLACSDL